MLVESGGDNLTATFSPALVDAQFFVLDVAGGGDVARKGGPGIARADALVVNKTDLAPYVGVDVEQMVADAEHARDGRTVLPLSRQDPASVARVRAWVLATLAEFRTGRHVAQDPGPMAPHFHAGDGARRTATPRRARPTATSTRIPTEAPAPTTVAVDRVDGRHVARLRQGLLRPQVVASGADRCRIGLLATTALLLGGDVVELDVRVGPGARLDLFDVAGTVAYHGRGEPSGWHVRVALAEGAALTYAGEPFVVGDGADVTRTLRRRPRARRLGGRAGHGRAGPYGSARRPAALAHHGAAATADRSCSRTSGWTPTGCGPRPGMLGPHRVLDTVVWLGTGAARPTAATTYALVDGAGTAGPVAREPAWPTRPCTVLDVGRAPQSTASTR